MATALEVSVAEVGVQVTPRGPVGGNIGNCGGSRSQGLLGTQGVACSSEGSRATAATVALRAQVGEVGPPVRPAGGVGVGGAVGKFEIAVGNFKTSFPQPQEVGGPVGLGSRPRSAATGRARVDVGFLRDALNSARPTGLASADLIGTVSHSNKADITKHRHSSHEISAKLSNSANKAHCYEHSHSRQDPDPQGSARSPGAGDTVDPWGRGATSPGCEDRSEQS